MKPLRCVVVDDEPLAVKMLENYISKTSFLELEASFTDPVAALETIRDRRLKWVHSTGAISPADEALIRSYSADALDPDLRPSDEFTRSYSPEVPMINERFGLHAIR